MSPTCTAGSAKQQRGPSWLRCWHWQAAEQAAATGRSLGSGKVFEAAMFAALAGHLPLMQGACSGWQDACWAAARAWLEASVDAGELGRAALLLLLLWCPSAAPVREGSDGWLLYIAAGYSQGLWSKPVLAGVLLG